MGRFYTDIQAHVTRLTQITSSAMARALHDGSTSERVGNIQSDAGRTFPADVSACAASSRICEQNLPVSHPAPVPAPPSMCQRCLSLCQNHPRDRLEMVNSCESGPSSPACEQRHCSYPESFSTGEPTAYGLRHTTHEHSNMGTDVEESHQDDPQAELPLAGDVPVEREIALRLRRIGDQMNERYLRRRQVAQRQWWGPLRWHLTQMISEILAALYNPLVDILPQN
ncbi:bcl-2-binding component 3-like isoform X1 [Rana temporaria]|uniref:bcl-2-binding component 3-like isoform X1 n=2 Tax=Rana temporaria TaxID=8407 RepID=UPI001AAC5672|nr:bcl-2-binding component 3-like isoform X1 [Rana temporaria]